MKIQNLFVFIILQYVTRSYAVDETNLVKFTAEELLKEKVANEKSILRYGFQKSECKNFKITYLCMHKCVYVNKYDVAYVDKKCVCTCYNKKEKPKMIADTNIYHVQLPETSVPYWVIEEKASLNINNNMQSKVLSHVLSENVTGSEDFSPSNNYNAVNETVTILADVSVATRSSALESSTITTTGQTTTVTQKVTDLSDDTRSSAIESSTITSTEQRTDTRSSAIESSTITSTEQRTDTRSSAIESSTITITEQRTDN